MAKRTDRSFTAICDLIDCIANYCETLKVLPDDSNIYSESEQSLEKYTFFINSPQERADAIIKILFGEEEIRLKRGNRSFAEHDRELIIQMHEEIKALKGNEGEKITKEQFLNKYADLAQARSSGTQEDSVRARLDDAYYKYLNEQKNKKEIDIDYKEDEGAGFENLIADELHILSPWLEKYREELINFLKP